MFLVKQVVNRFGIGISLVLMPIASAVGFAALAFEPSLLALAIVSVIWRALRFGFTKPTTDMLYSVVPVEDKYKVKTFIDTAVYRAGDLVGVWSVAALAIRGIAGVAALMVPLAVFWSVVSLWLGRSYRDRARALRAEESTSA